MGRIRKGEFVYMEKMVLELLLSIHQEGKAKAYVGQKESKSDGYIHLDPAFCSLHKYLLCAGP